VAVPLAPQAGAPVLLKPVMVFVMPLQSTVMGPQPKSVATHITALPVVGLLLVLPDTAFSFLQPINSISNNSSIQPDMIDIFFIVIFLVYLKRRIKTVICELPFRDAKADQLCPAWFLADTRGYK
jgi:hypothetical protein